jgi:DNA-binding LytR/AlgR family response regulator
MPNLRILIADDELPARNKMKRLLENVEGVELLKAAENGIEALQAIHELKPDLVFLDVEMPGLNGLEVAEGLEEMENPPAVVFATAYNEHAIKAFELNAVDYLLKPFNEERLRMSIDKVLSGRTPKLTREKLGDLRRSDLADEIRTPFSNKIPIPTRDRYKLIDFSEVVCLEVEDRNVRLFTKEKSYLLNQTLDSFEQKLPSDRFFRVNRSCLIGLEHIKEIVIWFGNRFKIILDNGKEVISSREKSKILKHVLKF